LRDFIVKINHFFNIPLQEKLKIKKTINVTHIAGVFPPLVLLI